MRHLTLAFLLSSCCLVVSAHSGHRFSAVAFVTPVIDGALSPGEWSDAQSFTFVTGCDLEPLEMTVSVKNDATFLYIGLVVRNDDEVLPDEIAVVRFDNLHDGIGSPGDNAWVTSFSPDRVYAINIAGNLVLVGDTFNGGTDEVLAASTHGVDHQFELAAPLDSNDDDNDFSLTVGDTIGFNVSFGDTNSPCNSGNLFLRWWPELGHRNLTGAADLLIASVDDLDEVCLCHRPPGNPSRTQFLCVEPDAVAAHRRHGDTFGECDF